MTSYHRSTCDRWPLDPLTPLPCISCLMCLPFLARHTRLDRTFLRSFWSGHGLWPKKVPLLLTLACCVVFAMPPIPTNPPAQLLPLFCSPIPVKIHLRTLTGPSSAFPFRLCSHIFLGSKRSHSTVRGAAGAPTTPLYSRTACLS